MVGDECYVPLTVCAQGPFTEEWVFRSCMCPLLICGGFSWTQTIFLSPFFFCIGTLDLDTLLNAS
jgi:hypothetical protein